MFELGFYVAAFIGLSGMMAAIEAAVLSITPAEVEELRGDVNLAQGDTEGARGAYAATLAMAETSVGRRERVQMKLDDLGHIQVSTESE